MRFNALVIQYLMKSKVFRLHLLHSYDKSRDHVGFVTHERRCDWNKLYV